MKRNVLWVLLAFAVTPAIAADPMASMAGNMSWKPVRYAASRRSEPSG
jgi:hypothetical protein